MDGRRRIISLPFLLVWMIGMAAQKKDSVGRVLQGPLRVSMRATSRLNSRVQAIIVFHNIMLISNNIISSLYLTVAAFENDGTNNKANSPTEG